MYMYIYCNNHAHTHMAEADATRLALVTGSTSGIGESIAYALASKSMNVIINGFGSEEQIGRVVEACRQHGAPRVEYCPADLSDVEQIQSMFKEIVVKFGKTPDVLVNNAGIQHVSPLEEFSAGVWDKMMAVNLSASFHTSRLCVAGMKERGWGRIVNIASAHGLRASPFKIPYCATKHGLVGLTKGIAVETAGSGVTCNAVCPGYVLTPLTIPQAEAIMEKRGCSLEEAKLALLEKQPSKQFVLPNEIGGTVLFLCSDDAKQITGTTLSIDGGWTAS